MRGPPFDEPILRRGTVLDIDIPQRVTVFESSIRVSFRGFSPGAFVPISLGSMRSVCMPWIRSRVRPNVLPRIPLTSGPPIAPGRGLRSSQPEQHYRSGARCRTDYRRTDTFVEMFVAAPLPEADGPGPPPAERAS